MLAMLHQMIDAPLALFLAGFFTGFLACWMTRPVRTTKLAAVADEVSMSVHREFAKMAW